MCQSTFHFLDRGSDHLLQSQDLRTPGQEKGDSMWLKLYISIYKLMLLPSG